MSQLQDCKSLRCDVMSQQDPLVKPVRLLQALRYQDDRSALLELRSLRRFQFA